MALVRPGGVLLAMVLIIVSNTFYSYGESLTAAFLPELARPESMGKVSGWGWGFGYLGGMLTLVGCLAYVLHAQGQGQGASHFVPVTLLITAVVYALAASVTFALLRERAQGVSSDGAASSVGAGFTRLKQTFGEARRYGDFIWLLACTVAYQGGVAVAIKLAAIYAEQVIGFLPQETMVLILVLNVASAAGFTAAPRMAAYNVSKAGVVSLSETLAAELAGSGVAVTVLCPTFVRTNIFDGELIEPGAAGLARRIAGLAGFSAERVARTTLNAHDSGRLYVVPQLDAQLLWRTKRLLPAPYTRAAGLLGRLVPDEEGSHR